MNIQRKFAALVLLTGLLAACGSAQPLIQNTATPAATAVATETSASTAAVAPTASAATAAPAATAPSNPAASNVVLNCQDRANLNSGRFRAENNTWGKGSLTGWSQCIGLQTIDDGMLVGRWMWD